MYRDIPLTLGETYHVYNRGAHKQNVFINKGDYERFVLLLHIMNGRQPVDMRRLLANYKGRSFVNILEEEKPDKSLVAVRAYSLMPNHFHLVVQQKIERGISLFMKKLLTGYSMYFNTKYEHSGVVFQGRFKSKHIDNEAYFRYIFSYVHLNALGIHQPGWEEGGVADPMKARQFMREYPYSSYHDYSVGSRPEGAILEMEDTPDFLKTQNDLEDLFNSYKGRSFVS